MNISRPASVLSGVMFLSVVTCIWPPVAIADEAPDETAGDIVNAILPNAESYLPSAAAGGDQAGCGGEASFFNNEDTCASMGSKPTVPVMSEAACDRVVAGARSIDRPIQFALDKAVIEQDYALYLRDSVAVAFNDQRLRPCLRFVVEGHTDASGPDDYNLDLSNQRASAVVDFLVDHGVGRSRLQSIGYGEKRLANQSDPNAAENRRVTFRPEPLAAN